MALSLAETILIPMLVILTSLAVEAMSPAFAEDVVTKKFEQWMSQHQRFYQDDLEKAKRFKIFKDNLEFVEKFNNMKKHSFTLGINQFSDLTEEEFETMYGCNYASAVTETTKPASRNMSKIRAEVPDSIDWRNKTWGAVTSVKAQYGCGACWAFAAVGAIEGAVANGESLSVQQLIDCVSEFYGCNGGSVERSFDYVMYHGGISSELLYPYVQKKGTCREMFVGNVAQILDYVVVETNNEEELKAAVARQPVVGQVATCPCFSHYKGGLYEVDCGINLSHSVVIVGYGTTDDGRKFWLIKNSWGQQWGEKGYMRLLRNASRIEGLCGIARRPSYPIVGNN